MSHLRTPHHAPSSPLPARALVAGALAASVLSSCALLQTRARVPEGTRVVLSFPADTKPTQSYSWIQTDGPTVELENADTAEASFVAPQASENYRLAFARLSEVDGAARSRQFGVLVDAEDDPPAVEAGETVFVGEGETVRLEGGAADPEGDELAFSWRQLAGPRVAMADADTRNATFRAPTVNARTYLRFELLVSDAENEPVPDEVTVVVDPVDSDPELSVKTDLTAREGERVTLEARGVDPEGADLAYVWSLRAGAPPIALEGKSGPQPSFVAPPCPDGVDSYTLTFDVTATDGANFSRAERVVVTVVALEGLPIAEAGEDVHVKEGELVRLMGSASHPEGKELTYVWRQTEGEVPLRLNDARTLTPVFTAPEVPDGQRSVEAVLSLIVSDGEHRSSDLVRIRIAPAFPPRPKRAALEPGQVDPLLAVEEGRFLRWIRAQVAEAAAPHGFFAAAPPASGRPSTLPDKGVLEGRFLRRAGSMTCDLPPGAWSLEGSVELAEIEPPTSDDAASDGRGVVLRLETAEGEAVGLGLVTLGDRLGVQIRQEECDLFTGEWDLDPDSLRLLQDWSEGTPLHFAITWKHLRLGFQWAASRAGVAEAPRHEIELSRAPELHTLLIQNARAKLRGLQLVGPTQ